MPNDQLLQGETETPIQSTPTSAQSQQLQPGEFEAPAQGAPPAIGTVTAPPSAWDRFTAAFTAPFKSMYHGATDEPQDANEIVAHAQGGQGGLAAYRAAKKLVDAHDAMMNAKPGDAARKAAFDFQNSAIDMVLGNTHDAIMHAVSGGFSTAGAVDPGMQSVLERPRAISEGATAGGDLATPLGSTAADVAIAAATYGVGKGLSAIPGALKVGQAAGEVADATPAIEEAAATPKAQAVAEGTSRAAKAGISEGTAETVAPTGEDIQPHLHQGIRDFVNQVANDAGLEPVPESTPITDAPQKLADAFQSRSQATFDKVEEITGLNPTTLKEQMAARADQMTEAAAAGDTEKAGKLEMLQKASENKALQAFNQAKAQGVDVDQARADWNSSIRSDELSAAVRGSKANTSTLESPVLDPNKLAPRLQRLAESQPGGKAPKLFQLGGEDSATGLVEHAENAREAVQAIKDFVPQSATGQKLFSQILSDNTVEKSSLLRGGKVTGATDWNAVIKDLGNLTPEQQAAAGSDLAKMRQVASRQAVKQNAIKALKVGGVLGAGEEIARRGINALTQ